MSNWQTALVSLAALVVGAAVAVLGAIYKEPTLTNLGSTIIGGSLGMFVPHRPANAQPQRRPTLPPAPPRP